VEIDLVRSGDWTSLISRFEASLSPHTAYRACIRRADHIERIELYPIPLRNHLPTLPIPLRQDDPLVTLDLQDLLNRAYQTGRYGGLNYKRECDPPLSEEDAAWGDQLLKDAGRR
jgi:hypothetical protein